MLQKNSQHTVPVVHKTLDIMQRIALNPERAELTVKALAAETGTTLITCYRILHTLKAHDWVRSSSTDGTHALSQGFLRLARIKQPHDGLLAAARCELPGLAREIELTVKVSIRQDNNAVTLCRQESPRETAVSIREGATFPLAYGSSGAVLLSELPEKEVAAILKSMPASCWKYQTRQNVFTRLRQLKAKGYCGDKGTFNPGYHSISVPLRTAQKQCIGSLTAIGFPHEFDSLKLARLKKRLDAAARAIMRNLN